MKKIRRLLQPGGEQNPRRGGKTAHEQFEDRGGGVAMIQIDLNHLDLIEVGRQRAGFGFQCDDSFQPANREYDCPYDAIGLSQRNSGNRAKSPSVEQRVSPCSTAKAARCASGTRLP